MHIEDSDQTVQMRGLILIFAGHMSEGTFSDVTVHLFIFFFFISQQQDNFYGSKVGFVGDLEVELRAGGRMKNQVEIDLYSITKKPDGSLRHVLRRIEFRN